MKRFLFLFLLALLSCVTVRAQVQANIFASELKASAVSATNDVEFSYTLNADASSVTITVASGEVFEITEAADLTKGAHKVTKRLKKETAVGEYSWSVTAVGVAENTNTGENAVKFSDDANELRFFQPRGLGVDVNMDSPYFGRIYVANAREGAASGRPTEDGIYILNAALQDVTGQGDASYKGGQDWTLNGTANDFTPFRISVTKEGKVLIPHYWPADDHNIFIMDPADPTADFVPAFGAGAVHIRAVQAHLEGDDLYLLGNNGAAGSTFNIQFQKFADFSVGHTAAATSTISFTSAQLITYTISFVPDGRGGFWVSQYRSAVPSNEAAVLHINASGVIDLTLKNGDAGIPAGLNGGSCAYNIEKNLLAIGFGNTMTGNLARIYDVIWDEETGVPALGENFITTGAIANTIDGLEFDISNNLYAISFNTERLTGWALPNEEADDNAFVTTAPASQKVNVTFCLDAGLVKLWSKTYAWDTGNLYRDAIVSNGKLYVAHNFGTAGAATIPVINGADGTELTAEFITPVNNSFTLAADNAGNLIVPKNGGGSNTWQLQKVGVASKTVTPVANWTDPISYRTDFVSFRGNINSPTEKSYLIGASNTTNFVLAWEMLNGERTATPVFSYDRGEAGNGADVCWIDDTHILVTGQARIPKIMTLDFTATPYVTDVKPLGFTAAAHDCGGGTYFELGGIPYVVLPTTLLGAVNIYDITDLDEPVKMGPTTAALGTVANGGLHLGISAEKVADNEVIVYTWVPNNGAAAYKVTAVNAPILNPAPGEYDGKSLSIRLSSATAGAEIRYTLDGSTPDETSTLYTEPIEITEGETTIKMLATKDGLFNYFSEANYSFSSSDALLVTFESNGGSAVAAGKVDAEGEPVEKPADPKKPGFRFLGWFTEEDVEWDFDDPVTDNMTLFAKWDVYVNNIVSYDPQGDQQLTLRPIVRVELTNSLFEGITDLITVTDKDGEPVSGVYSYMEVPTGKSVMHYIFDEDLNPNETYKVAVSADATGEAFEFTFVPRQRNSSNDERLHELIALTGFSMTQDPNCIVPVGDLTAAQTLAAISSVSDMSPSADITGSTKWSWTWKPGLVTSTNAAIQTQRTYLRYHNATLLGQANKSKDGQFQYYMFGDGSNCRAGLSLYDGSGYYCQDIEVDWVGWKLITWDMRQDTKTYLNWISGTYGGTPTALPAGGARVSGFIAITAADPDKVWYGENNIYISDLWYRQFEFIVVTFDSDGGSAVKEGLVAYEGATVARPADPTKTGHEFLGWFTEGDVEWDFNDPVTEDMTLTAQWFELAAVYVVTFDPDNGAEPSEVDVEDGQTVKKPADPKKLGSTFVGWFTEEDEEWDFEEDVVTEDITLTAKWTVDEYTVTFDSRGGTPVTKQEGLIYGAKVTEPAPPVRDGGFEFLGWFTAPEMGTLWDFEETGITGDLTLFAQWKSDFLIVASYDPQGVQAINIRPIVRIQFNEELDNETIFDEEVVEEVPVLTIKEDLLVVTDAEGKPVEGVASYFAINGKCVFHFIFSEDLVSGDLYTVTLAKGIKSKVEETEMKDDFVFTFTPRNREVLEKMELGHFTNTEIPLEKTNANPPHGWYRPTASGANQTAGVIREPLTVTNCKWDVTMVPTVQTPASLRLDYQWDKDYNGLVDGAPVQPQIRWHYTDTEPTFSRNNIIQYYLFGDGSNSQFSIQVWSTPSSYTVNKVTVDWVGWRLISWDLENDVAMGYLVNSGPQTFPETGLRFNGAHTMSPPADQRTFEPSAMWASQLRVVKLGPIDGAVLVSFETGFGAPIPGVYVGVDEEIPASYFAIDNLAGWYKDAAFINEWLPTDVVTEDITLFAKWETVFTVDFVSVDVVVETYENVPVDVTIPKPADPAREGYTFQGWFTTGEWLWDFDTDVVTEDLTLTAKWVKSWTVTFESDGSAVAPASVIDGAKVAIPTPPTKTGHTFDKWYLGENAYNFDTPVTADITLLATWTRNSIEVTFMYNYDGGPANLVKLVLYGDKVEKPEDPVRAGYIFDGWFTSTAYLTPFDFEAETFAARSAVAKWSVLRYTVTFDSQGGSTVLPQQVAEGDYATIPEPPTRQGFAFNGWFTEEDVKWDFANNVITKAITLFAKWTSTQCTVTFNSMGGSAVIPATVTVDIGARVTKPDRDPTKDGYIFDGWFTDENCTQEWDFNNVVNETMTLYAKWAEKTHTVTFNTNGGSEISPATVPDGGKVTKPADPTKSGFKFDGWFREAALTNAYNFDAAVTSSFTLFAKWATVTGVESFDVSSAKVYPNPTDGVFTIEFAVEATCIVSITDMAGKTLLKQTVNDKFTQIDISSFPAGVYLITINDDNGQSVTRIVKK